MSHELSDREKPKGNLWVYQKYFFTATLVCGWLHASLASVQAKIQLFHTFSSPSPPSPPTTTWASLSTSLSPTTVIHLLYCHHIHRQSFLLLNFMQRGESMCFMSYKVNEKARFARSFGCKKQQKFYVCLQLICMLCKNQKKKNDRLASNRERCFLYCNNQYSCLFSLWKLFENS